MKYVKLLGLAAVAATALMAFVGASTASATVLCTTKPVKNAEGTENATCPEGWAHKAGTKIHAVNEGNVNLTAPKGTVLISCKKSTVSGETENEGSAIATVEGKITALTFEECNCEVTVIENGSLEVHWLEDTVNGTLTSSGATVTTTCTTIFGKVHCNFITKNTDLGRVTGGVIAGEGATIETEEAFIKQEETSPLCPAEAFWDAKYEVTEPKPLYVSKET